MLTTLLLSCACAPLPAPVPPQHVAQQAYLKASDGDGSDYSGYAVAMSGDTVVVGAPGKGSGRAYVFVKNGTSWAEQAVLIPSNPTYADEFGEAVAISGDTIVVGAGDEDSIATGVNGDGSDNSAYQAGAAYVFVRNGTTWSEQAYLKASNTEDNDKFGEAVAIVGEVIAVGAKAEDSDATGVNGDQTNNNAWGAGAVYIFTRSGTTWIQETYLKASNAGNSDYFGMFLSIQGDTLVVGAPFEWSSATGVNGDQSDNTAPGSGAAYVFVHSGTTWTQEAYLKASNTQGDDYFGSSVAVSGGTAVIGARNEDSYATGVNGDQSNNNGTHSGAAYVFVRNGTSWSQEVYLKASNTGLGDHFGAAAAVLGDTVVVGAFSESSNANGVNGNEYNNGADQAGAAYLFTRNGTTWSQEAYVKASNSNHWDEFGTSVAMAGDTLVVGAAWESSSAQGINGDQLDNSAWAAGAAYAFDLDAPLPGVPYCFGDPGSGTACPCSNDNDGSVPGSGCANGVFASGAQLSGTGAACVSNDSLVLKCSGLEPNNSGLYFQANNDLSPGIVWGDGLRCAGGDLRRLSVRTSDGYGNSDTSLFAPITFKAGNIAPGDTKYYQCWYRTTVTPPCGAGVNDFNSSNGYAVTWLP